MHKLPLSSVPQWCNVYGKWAPTSVDTLCPHCSRMVNLPLDGWNDDGARKTLSATGRCPACSKTSDFWIIMPGDARDSSQRGCEALCIYPAPRMKREPIVGLDKLNPALARAYISCLEAYNAGLWTPCAASCRRALEGLVLGLLGDEAGKAPLYQQLKQLPSKVNLADPVLLLIDNLRKGGNIAAHFDLEREPDQHVAEAMIDLLDYFFEYVYVWRERASSLETRIEALGKNETKG